MVSAVVAERAANHDPPSIYSESEACDSARDVYGLDVFIPVDKTVYRGIDVIPD